MATSSSQQAAFRPLSELLSKNEAGEAEFQHIVSVLLRFDVSQKAGEKQRVVPTCLSPGVWLAGHTLCVCLFPSQGDRHDYNRLFSLASEQLTGMEEHQRPNRLVVVQPHVTDTASSTSTTFQQCMHAVHEILPWQWTAVLWDATHLHNMLITIPPLSLRYYPEFLPDGLNRQQAIMTTRQRYDQEFAKLHSKIQFVGMSVYKEEASASVDMRHYRRQCIILAC